MDDEIMRIAHEVLGFESVMTRGRDDLDFKEVAVWVLKTKDFTAAPQAEMLGLRINVMFSAQAHILFQP
jgi:hypothetical protein